jgi:hypothetical protein
MEPDSPGESGRRIMRFIHYPGNASCCLQIWRLHQ